MDDSTGLGSSGQPTIVDTWLEPLGDTPCGDDLEWDNDFLELAQAAAGKPGTQFSDPVPPDWRTVQRLSESLFERTRDVRVAILWARAQMNIEGASTLPESFRLIHGLLERWWDDVHPRPDDGDAYARINALNDMASTAGLFGDLRNGTIFASRSVGELHGREVEIALGLLEPRDGEGSLTPAHLEQMLAAAVQDDPSLRTMPQRALEELEKISALMNERVGYAAAPDLGSLTKVLSGLAKLMPGEGGAEGASDGASWDAGDTADADEAPVAAASGGGRRIGRPGLSGGVESREDALRAIDMVCAYLERTEPTNPAQFFLRRARKLVDKNFLELVRELAPESLDQVARIMGVTAEELGGSPY